MTVVRRRKRDQKSNDRLSRRMQRRLTLTFGLICVLFVVLIGRLMYIEYTEGERYKKIVLSQLQYDSSVIPYKRGDIIDSKGTVLATSVDVYNVILDARVLNENDEDVISATVKAVDDCFPEITSEQVKEALKEKPNRAHYGLERFFTLSLCGTYLLLFYFIHFLK